MDGYATSMHKSVMGITVLAFALGTVSLGRSAEEQVEYGIGRPTTEEEIRAWNIDVSPTGEGLPPGQGTVKQGAQVTRENAPRAMVRPVPKGRRTNWSAARIR